MAMEGDVSQMTAHDLAHIGAMMTAMASGLLVGAWWGREQERRETVKRCAETFRAGLEVGSWLTVASQHPSPTGCRIEDIAAAVEPAIASRAPPP